MESDFVVSSDGTLTKYTGSAEIVMIPEGVTTIADQVFTNNTKIRKVVLPEGVTAIADAYSSSGSYGVFRGCTSLKEVEFPSTLTKIGQYAFRDCKALTSVSLPEGLKKIGSNAFNGTNITSLKLPDSITSLNASSLYGVAHVKWTAGIPKVPNSAFSGNTTIVSIEFPMGVTELEGSSYQGMFSSCTSLVEVSLPASIEKIGNNVFKNSEYIILKVDPASYAEQYAIDNELSYAYNGETITVTGEALAACAGMTIRLSKGSFEATKQLNGETRVSFSGLSTEETYALAILNGYGDAVYQAENLTVSKETPVIELPESIGMANVTLNVRLPDRTNVTQETVITWYAEDGSVYAEGNVLTGVPYGRKLNASVQLNDALGGVYMIPAPAEYVAGETGEYMSVNLAAREMVNVTGRLTDGADRPVEDAVVTAVQTVEGFAYTRTVETGKDGTFTLPVNAAAVQMTISAPGFVEKTVSLEQPAQNAALGSIVLDYLDADVIVLSLTYIAAAEEKAVRTTDIMLEDIRASVVNETTGAELTAALYGRYLYVTGDVNDGDTLRVTLSSASGLFDTYSDVVTAAGNMKLGFEIVQRGSVIVSWADSYNPAVRVMTYDADGLLVDQMIAQKGGVRGADLTAGEYTVVLMGASKFVPAPEGIGGLNELGLSEGEDYLAQKITVETGIIGKASFEAVPQLDLSEYYCTDKEKTSFSVNKSAASAGDYIALRAQAAFEAEAAGRVGNIR